MQLKAYSKGNIFLRISSWQMYFCVTCIFAILVFLHQRKTQKSMQLTFQFFRVCVHHKKFFNFYYSFSFSSSQLLQENQKKLLSNFSLVATFYTCDQSYLYDMPCAFEPCSLATKNIVSPLPHCIWLPHLAELRFNMGGSHP